MDDITPNDLPDEYRGLNDADEFDIDDATLQSAEKVAKDCYDYFIRGFTDRHDGGLCDLFYQIYTTEHGVDHYPEVSELCMRHSQWLAEPEYWNPPELVEFLDDFEALGIDSPNYGWR